MKRLLLSLFLASFSIPIMFGQGVPELMYYKFDGTGTSAVPNLASSPVGTSPAPFVGTALSQGPTGQFGNALIGGGASSTTDYLNTGWATSLSGDWTISFWCSNIQPSGTLWYIFGDPTAGNFRCFTNGVAGANNWILRGTGVTDVLVSGGAVVTPNVIHFVYDNTVPEIRAYLNGALVNTVAQAAPLNITGAGPFKVGAATSTGLGPGHLMDEFRLYNRALTPAEITATYNQTLPLVVGPKDVAVTNLTSPLASNTTCYTDMETIAVNLWSFGSDTLDLSTDNVKVTVNVTGPNPQTYSTTLTSGIMNPGTSMPVVVTAAYDMSAPGTHVFDAYAEFVTGGPDANLANDTMTTSSIFNSTTALGAGGVLVEDFESWTAGNPGTFATGWSSVTPNTNAGWWVENDGIQNTTNTGPIDDHTQGGSTYIYTETSSGSPGDTYILTSPCIDMTGATAPRLSFWYHMFGTTIGTFAVRVTTSGGFDSLVFSAVGAQQFAESDPWLQGIVNLDWAIDSVIKAEFIGIRGAGGNGDIGLDDIQLFNAAPIDIAAVSIVSPTDPACYSNSENITVRVQNVGSQTIDYAVNNLTVTLNVTGPVPQVFTPTITSGTLAPLATQDLIITTNADLSLGGIYNFEAIAGLTGDPNAFNDTTLGSAEALPVSNGLQENFETFIVGSPGTFLNGWSTYSTSASTTLGWTVEQDGVANSGSTGPIDDHTPGGQIYVYTETSGIQPTDTMGLVSSCVDLTTATNPILTWWYHMFGANIGTLEVHILWNGMDSTVWSLTGQQQTAETDPWLTDTVDMAFWIGQTIQVEFRSFGNVSFTADMALDDILLFSPSPVDAGVSALTDPLDPGCFGPADSLKVEVSNYGTAALDFAVDNMTVTVDVTGASTNSYSTTVTSGTLALGATMEVLVTAVADFSNPGIHNLSMYTTIGNDPNTFNDSASATVESFPTLSAPFTEDFEAFTVGANGTAVNPNGWTTTTTSTSTALGWTAEQDGVGNSTGTGPVDDHTNGGQIYIYTETSGAQPTDTFELISPCVDLSGSTAPKLGFWYHMFGPNMGTLEVVIRTDTGDAVVWSISGQQQTAETDPWLEGTADLTAFNNQASLLIVFRSYGNVSFTADMALDDINLFEPPPYDVKASQVLGPGNGCGLSAAETVSAEFFNFGLDTLDNVIGSFSVDGGAFTSPENVTGTFAPGDTGTHTFTATADLSVPGIHTITVVFTQTAPADTNNVNDTVVYTVTHYNAYAGSYPYFENFDGPGWVPNNVTFSPGAPVITLDSGWVNLQTDGQRDWIIRSAPTGNVGTGPDFDHTTGSTNYVYVEDSWEDDSVIMISPCFDVSGFNSPQMEFWYHSNNGNDPNNESFLHVDLIDGSNTIYDIIPPIGHKDNNWNKIEIDLSPYGPVFSVRFRGESTNSSFLHDIAIDDFGLYDVIPQDAGMAGVFTPQSGCGLTANEDLTLAISNLGTDSILTNVSINYQISLNGVAGAVNTLPSPQDTIAPGVSVPVIISGQDFSTPGTYTVVTWTSGLAGDTNGFNDTVSVDIINIPVITTYPYSEDFENGDGGWVVEGVSTTFELTTPANVVINSAASGINSWITNATGLYNNNEDGYVIGPCFDFTNLAAPKIEMAVWWESEFSWDGANLQSSVDNGISWQNVGVFGDPDNWYTDNTINGAPGGSQEGWTGRNGSGATGGSNGWVIAKHALDSLGGEPNVRLRVAFGSDGSVQDDGFAFDDIFIFDTPDDDMGVTAFTQPAELDCSSDSTIIEVMLVNFGLDTQSMVPVTVDITGAATTTVNGTFPGPLAPGDTAFFVVGTFNSNVGGTFNFTGYTVLGGDTLGFNDTTLFASDISISALPPTVTPDSTCAQDSAQFMLIANTSSTAILWYDTPGGNVIHQGDTLMTPFLTSTTTYYAQATDQQMFSGFTPADNTIGGGGNYTFFADGLVFDVFQDITINTVKVYPNGAGTIVVNVNDNTGALVETASFPFAGTVPDTTVTLNFDIPAGTGYEMDAQGTTTGGLFRNSGGATFPYDVPGVVSLTNTINGLGASSGFYYFFYDWNVTSFGCPSPLVPVDAVFLPDVPVDLGADGTACEGEVLDAFLPQIVSYQWSTGDTTSSISVNTLGPNVVYVDVVDVNGCTGTDTVNLLINASPSVDLGPVDTTACDQIILDAGNPGATYVWSVPGVFTQTITVNDSGTYYVDVTLLGCTSSDTINVDIADAPVVDLGADLTTCNPVPLDAGNPGLSFSWSTGDNSQTIVAIPPSAGSDTVSVTVTDPASGCETTDAIVITAGTPPVVDLGPDTAACDSFVLDAGNPGATYLWSTGATTQSITAMAAGTYTVSVTAADGCEATDTVDVNLELSPVAGFTYNWVSFGFTFDFSDASANGTSYFWDFGDGNTSTDPNPTHTYGFSATFLVTQIVTNDCGSDTIQEIVGPTDIDDDLFGSSISVYPNPTAGEFWVEGIDVQAAELTIEVTDARGRQVFKQVNKNVFAGFKHRIDLTNEAEGVYVVKISDGDRTAYKRVIRE